MKTNLLILFVHSSWSRLLGMRHTKKGYIKWTEEFNLGALALKTSKIFAFRCWLVIIRNYCIKKLKNAITNNEITFCSSIEK